MQKNVAQPKHQVSVSPAQLQLLRFLTDIDPEDLHEVAMSSLYLLADSEEAEDKRWILVRFADHFHRLAMEKGQ